MEKKRLRFNNLNKIKALNTVFDNNVIPVAFASSDYFAPYLGVTLQSIIDKCDENYNYDFVVFTKDMSDFSKKLLHIICNKQNVSLRFINVKDIFADLKLFAPGHITIETYFRLIIPLFMKNYNKILFLDSDLLILEDIKNLYQYNIEDWAIAATEECLMSALVGLCGNRVVKYMKETLKLKDIDKYLQAGVMLINIDYFNKNNCSQELMDMVLNFDYNIVDQDAINELLNDKCFWLPNEWNYPPLQKHMKELKYIDNMSDTIREKYLAVKEPKILHFADRNKPWFDPTEDYALEWWTVARKTPFYEEILKRMSTHYMNYEMTYEMIKDVTQYRKNILKYWKYKILYNLVSGETHRRYARKKNLYKAKIRNARQFIKS